jgi:hypothetical protein
MPHGPCSSPHFVRILARIGAGGPVERSRSRPVAFIRTVSTAVFRAHQPVKAAVEFSSNGRGLEPILARRAKGEWSRRVNT